MDVQEYLDGIPFQNALGIEITRAEEGHAEAELELRPDLSSSRQRVIGHGGVISVLVDSVGGAAAISLNEVITPTINLRIDYLEPAERDLRATGEVIRNGRTFATVDIDIRDVSGTHVATAQGLYKTTGGDPMEWVEPES